MFAADSLAVWRASNTHDSFQALQNKGDTLNTLLFGDPLEGSSLLSHSLCLSLKVWVSLNLPNIVKEISSLITATEPKY